MENNSSVSYTDEDEFLNMTLKPSYMVEDYMEVIYGDRSEGSDHRDN